MERYTINDVSRISGFTTRTLRSYIDKGLLEGVKDGGVWYFDAEKVGDFLSNPNVRPGITSKLNAQVFDFMLCGGRERNRACVILDLDIDLEEAKRISDFFCDMMNHMDVSHIEANEGVGSGTCGARFFMQRNGSRMRLVLSGEEEAVSSIMKAYYCSRQ